MEAPFKQSQNINLNYAATIMRVDGIEPIKGADRIVMATMGNNRVVISSDAHVGDIVVFFPLESVVSAKYLKHHNLYKDFLLNSNRNEYTELRDELSSLKVIPNRTDKQIEMMAILAVKMHGMHGMFDKSGRVRMKKIRGVYSMGYIAPVESLIEVWPELKTVIWSHHLGEQFDMIGDDVVCSKWMPTAKNKLQRSSQHNHNKAMKKLKQFDKLIDGQFAFHYDTGYLENNIDKISPFDDIDITVKVHGRSVILANVLVNKPHKLTMKERMKKLIRKPVPEYDQEYDVLYSSRRVIRNQYIYPKGRKPTSSVNPEDAIYDCVYRDFAQFIHPGMTVYGEVVGYFEGTNTPIQCEGFPHDYGCMMGHWKFMPYRITTTDKKGNVEEWDIDRVWVWTLNLKEMLEHDHPELANKIMQLQILYQGRAGDMYSNLYAHSTEELSMDDYHVAIAEYQRSPGFDGTLPHYLRSPEEFAVNHWRTCWLDALKKDKELLKMEMPEPMCHHNVPREGVVIRKHKDPVAEAFKLKTVAHWQVEMKLHDKGIGDAEDVS